MTAPSATELPTAQPNVPANSRHPGPRAVPSVSSVLILPPGPIVDRHRRPQERLQAARRPPAYPNQARIIAPVTPSHPSAVLTPSTCMNRWIRAKPGRASSQSLIVRTAIRFRSVVPGLVRLLTFLLTGTWSAANNRSNVAALARLSSTSVSTSILNSLNLTSREASSPTNGCSRLAPMPPAASWTTLSAAATLGGHTPPVCPHAHLDPHGSAQRAGVSPTCGDPLLPPQPRPVSFLSPSC